MEIPVGHRTAGVKVLRNWAGWKGDGRQKYKLPVTKQSWGLIGTIVNNIVMTMCGAMWVNRLIQGLGDCFINYIKSNHYVIHLKLI